MGWQYASPYASHMLQEWSNMLRKGKQYASGGYMVRGTASLAVVLFWCGLLAGQPSPQRVAWGAAEPAGQMVNRLAGWPSGWLAS